MLVESFEGNRSFSEEEFERLIREVRVDDLLKVIADSGESEDHRTRAAERILSLYESIDERVNILHVVHIGDVYGEKYADRADEIGRINNT